MIPKLNTNNENKNEKIFFDSISYDPYFKNSLRYKISTTQFSFSTSLNKDRNKIHAILTV